MMNMGNGRAAWMVRWFSVAMLGWAGMAIGQPVNDDCGSSLPIADGATPYNTTGATTDGPSHPECQFDGQTYNDIWYTYVATCTGELTVSTCNNASYDTDLVVYDGCDCGALVLADCSDDAGGCGGFTSEVAVSVVESNCYLIRIGGWQENDEGAGTLSIACAEPGDGACCFEDDTCTFGTQEACIQAGGDFKGEGMFCSPDPCGLSDGPDVIYTDVGGIFDYGEVGGIHAYALGSHTCNVGDEDLDWLSNGTPGLAMNAYRLDDGRIEQIGMSWVKRACCAAAGSGCGLQCNGNGGNVLGVGCRDVYSGGWNGGQSALGARSGINAFTGTIPGGGGALGDDIFKRLQIAASDLDSANFPNALYFVEGVYVGTDDAQSGNAWNNATYKRVDVVANDGLSEVGAVNISIPAIYAWYDHGGGVDTPDPSVEIVEVDVPLEGRFTVAGKAESNGDGTWRYAYAVFNLNSHRSGESLHVPFPEGTVVSNVGFHDVDYHSGEPPTYNADWTVDVGATGVTWSSPETFDQNPDSNALRWGTMYTFWFDADASPEAGAVTLGLFRPGTPTEVTAILAVPTGGGIPIPTVSEWGLVVLALLLLAAGTVVFGRRRAAAA